MAAWQRRPGAAEECAAQGSAELRAYSHVRSYSLVPCAPSDISHLLMSCAGLVRSAVCVSMRVTPILKHASVERWLSVHDTLGSLCWRPGSFEATIILMTTGLRLMCS